MTTRRSRRRVGVEGRLEEELRRHLAQPLEAGDVGLGVLGQLGEDPVAVGVVRGPVGLLAPADPVEGRAGEIDPAVGEEAGQVAVEEGQKQRGDVVAVAVGVGQEDDLAVAEPAGVVLVVHAAAQRTHEVGELLVVEHLGLARLLGVEHLAAEGKIAWMSRSRPCLAEPPALSPSTMKSSE